MVFTVRTPTTGGSAALASSQVINVPTGTVDGDLLVVLIGTRGIAVVPDTITGWTKQGSTTNVASVAATLTRFDRIASSEPASYTWTFSGGTGSLAIAMLAINGGDSSTTLDADGGIQNGFTATGITTVTDGDLLILGALVSGAGTAATFTYPGGWTNQAQAGGTGGGTVSIGLATEVQSTHGATGNQTVTPSAGANGGASLFAVKAANAAPTAPGQPTSLTATPANVSMGLSWTAPASDGGAAITDYTIEYALASSGSWSTFSHVASNATSRTVTGLVNGTSYDFRVSAVNSVGTGSPSSTATATPRTVPGAPTIGTATAGQGTASITFSAPASNGGSSITGYRSTASPGGSTVTGASSPITHTGLTPGTAYTFTIAATNASGYGSESAASNSATPTAVQYYVNTATGNDGNDGLSSGAPKLTLQAAVTAAGNTTSVINVVAASGAPLNEKVTVATSGNLTITGSGTLWYIVASETHSSGFTNDGGGIYHKDLVWTPVSTIGYVWVTTLLETNGIELKRLFKNTSTPTTPGTTAFGISGTTLYVHLPAGQDPATNPLIVPRYDTAMIMTGTGTLNVSDAVSRYAVDGNFQQNAGTVNHTNCTAEYSTSNAGNGGGGFTQTSGTNVVTTSTSCLSRFASNDGWNGHGSGTMNIVNCHGAYNHGQGCSVHNTETMNVVGGEYDHNEIEGMLSIDSAVINLSGGAKFHDNIGAGIEYFATTSGTVSNIETYSNTGSGIVVGVGATVTGCLYSHDNGSADSPAFPRCSSSHRRRGLNLGLGLGL